MLGTLTSLLGSYSSVLGIEAVLNDDNELAIASCLLEKKNGQVRIVERKEKCIVTDFQNTDIPMVLNVSGNGILVRQTKLNGRDRIQIVDLLPDSRPEDFYLSVYYKGEDVYAGVIRKSQLDSILLSFGSAPIIAINIGPLALIQTMPLLFPHEEEMASAAYRVHRTREEHYKIVSEESLNSRIYYVNDQQVSTSCLIAFCSAFDVYIGHIEKNITLPAVVVQNKEDFLQKRIFKIAGVAMLGFFLILLLLNFVLYSQFTSKGDLLKEQRIMMGTDYQKADSLLKELEAQKSFFKQSAWLDNSSVSHYADVLAKSKPTSISWTELIIYPVRKLEDESLEFATNSIRIKGEVNDVYELNQWQQSLSRMEWVRSVELEFLKKNEETHKSIFSLLIIRNERN